jgi:hypothetical protein
MPHLSDEEKIIICCNLLGGTLRAIEERARLAQCCDGTELDDGIAGQMIRTAEKCDEKLRRLVEEEVAL